MATDSDWRTVSTMKCPRLDEFCLQFQLCSQSQVFSCFLQHDAAHDRSDQSHQAHLSSVLNPCWLNSLLYLIVLYCDILCLKGIIIFHELGFPVDRAVQWKQPTFSLLRFHGLIRPVAEEMPPKEAGQRSYCFSIAQNTNW